MNAIGVEVSEHVSEGHASVTYQGWTHTQVWCVYGHVSRHGAGRLVCVMVPVAASGPVCVHAALRVWVQCGGLGSTPVRGVHRAGSPTCGGCSAP